MTADLRQRIAAAIRPVQWQTYIADDGYPATAAGTPEEIADAVLVVLRQHLGPTAADYYRARWESAVVEARRQAARADTAEAELAKTRASTGRRRAVMRATAEENSRLRAELARTCAELATARAQIAAVLALPAAEPDALELMDPEQYHQAIGYNDGLAASTHAINDLAVAPTT